MRLEYHPDTASDLNRAIDFYDQQRAGLGPELRVEIYKTVDRILNDPFLYRPVVNQIRRCFVHRFPFSILYSVTDEDLIRILVIRHHRQHPQLGMNRE